MADFDISYMCQMRNGKLCFKLHLGPNWGPLPVLETSIFRKEKKVAAEICNAEQEATFNSGCTTSH